MNRALSTLALTAALLLAACHKPAPDPARASASADAPGLLAPEMSADASAWVNGAPSPLSAAKGSVVFVEAWDRL